MPWPRLSVASGLLPLIRRHLLAAGQGAGPAAGQPCGLQPVFEDGLFGYELIPESNEMPYLIVGCPESGTPTVRRTFFADHRTGRLALVSTAGRTVGRPPARSALYPRKDERRFGGWEAAAAAALASLPPRREPDAQLTQSIRACRSLEDALAVATLLLGEWDPAVEICGLPHEAEHGFSLQGVDAARGTLVLYERSDWVLTWRAGPEVVVERWPALSIPRPSAASSSWDAAG